MLPPDQSLLAAVKTLLETEHADFINDEAPCRVEDARAPRQRPMWVLKADAGTDRHPQLKAFTLTVDHRVTDEADLAIAGQQLRAVYETLQKVASFVSLRTAMAADQCILNFFRPSTPSSAAEGERGRSFTLEVLVEAWQVPQS
jgi:hypothetical protein